MGVLLRFADFLGTLQKDWSEDQNETEAVKAIATREALSFEEAKKLFDQMQDQEHDDAIERAFRRAFGPPRSR